MRRSHTWRKRITGPVSDVGQVVLVVEDDPEIRYLLSVVLGADDRTIVEAATGAQAEDLLSTRSFDLIVLDLILPDADGRALLRRIRERPNTARTPVSVVSARGGLDIRQECYALGADLFTGKPFDPMAFTADVEALLERTDSGEDALIADTVSGLLNRAGIVAAFDQVGEGAPLALVQLDGLLSVSERWGWESAEQALERVGRAMRSAVGEDVSIGRLGGGEFLLLASGDGIEGLVEQAERALDAIRTVELSDPQGEQFRLTASIAVVDAVLDEGGLEQALCDARRRLCRAQGAGRNRVVAHDDRSDVGNVRVLVAEDDEISATILLHRLRKEGLDVTHYDNGREAYEAALEDTPDLVILDVKMPGMGGFEVLDRLRRVPSFSAVPIIMLTSMGGEADVVRGFKLGADDYVLKPFSPVELSARVWRLLRRGRSEGAL